MIATRSLNKPHRRTAFTMVELLVVIMILAILMSLLLPAINGVRRRARVAQVKTEISVLESAIASFKAEFGIEPPGSIRLYATAAGWNTATTGAPELIRVKSRAYIRQLWPQFEFNPTTPSYPTGTRPGGATWTSDKDLNGAECLVFFLGGVTDSATGTTMNGFSKSPALPFAPTGSNRVKPFYDFVSTRLVDKDADQMPEYVDPLPSQSSPYLYFSSNDGRGYATATIAADWCHTDCLRDGFLGATSWATGTWANGNWMQRLYLTSMDTTAATQALRATNSVPYAPKKYQIISPGFGGVGATPDKAYGTGGLFDPKNAAGMVGTADGDNITSFHGGTLSGE